jgi:hypothetical protein
MRFHKYINLKHLFHRNVLFGICAILLILFQTLEAQQKTTTMRVGRFWTGITESGYRGMATYTSGFFPNDYNIVAIRAQYEECNAGSGFIIATKMFNNPYKTDPVLYPNGPIDTVAVYGLINDFIKNGKITSPMTSYIRYRYPSQTIVNPTQRQTVPLKTEDWGAIYDPSKFTSGNYDQIIQVSNEYVYGITLSRKVLGWSQNYNDNYIIFDYEFTNNSTQTYDSLFIQTNCNINNAEYSNGRNPAPATSEGFVPARTWQHYHGGRISDTSMVFGNGTIPGKLRVFYEYSADDPTTSGDNMGGPAITQSGRLLGAIIHFYTILHASGKTYKNTSDDQDDFLQPRITYAVVPSQLPYSSTEDPYGDKNFWGMRGGLYSISKMSGNTFPGTFHSMNGDETGKVEWYAYPGGGTNESFMYSSFGPYNLAPGQKIHIVYASGWAGLDAKMQQEIGKKWINGTLTNPPSMPNANTGWYPPNFAFPVDAKEVDKAKDRWLSTGIDSVMVACYRAKWNHDHNYQIPQAPPPPSIVLISAFGDGTEISWSAPEAERLSNFAGYTISRRVSNMDTTFFEVIYDSDKNDKSDSSHIYKDRGVLALGQYYYYIQTKATVSSTDPNADPTTRGKTMYSNRVLFPNIYWVNPPRLSSDDLTKIRIAPNPYNIRDPLLRTFGYTDQRAINFYNLPASCNIKIFTENGDLVKTITHESSVRAGSETWDMVTDSQQVISGGVYIAVIQKQSGDKVILKFIVIR